MASPEVKRHLQEFVLQKKRKEAQQQAASMGNLKLVPTQPPSTAPPILRKTASESNLLKMKSGRRHVGAAAAAAAAAAAPYQHRTHPAIPEDDGDGQETKSLNSSPPVELSSPIATAAEAAAAAVAAAAAAATAPPSSSGSSPLGQTPLPQLQQRSLVLQQRSLDGVQLSSSTLNSKSLPNIPSAVSKLAGRESLFKRKSPPPHISCAPTRPAPHHGAMIVRRSKSSAILPLRKHLIEKTLQDNRKAIDTEQFFYNQQKVAAATVEIASDAGAIRPIEEVMEEDRPGGGGDSMEVDDHHLHHHSHSFTARLGPSGLSPLVREELNSHHSQLFGDYVTRLLPRQPLDLAKASAQSDATGLGYDPQMLRHHCVCAGDPAHPENPGRLLSVWNRLLETGLAGRCVRTARRATLEEIQSVHSEAHTLVYGTDMVNRCSLTGSQELRRESRLGKFCRLECGGIGVDSDTYWNELETPPAVRTAVGTVVELSLKVSWSDLLYLTLQLAMEYFVVCRVLKKRI